MKNAASSKRQALHDLFGSQRSTAHKHCSRLHLITLQHVKNHADISPAGSSICCSKLGSIQKLHLFWKVTHTLQNADERGATGPLCEHVQQRLGLLADLPAWGQLKSPGPVVSGPPDPSWSALIDWSLIFLTGWPPATKPRNSTERRKGRGNKRAFT